MTVIFNQKKNRKRIFTKKARILNVKSKGVRCYGGEPVFPYCAEHEPEDWFDEETYLEDLEESEEK